MTDHEAAIDIQRKTGLILSGGGARAAYQVGVLKAIADIIPKDAANPFHIISGTSAGAINGTALACYANRFHSATRRIELVWKSFTADKIYRTDILGIAGRSSRFLAAMFMGGVGARRPVSLLNNAPLRDLLSRFIRFERIQSQIDQGHLHAVNVCCSGYTSGESVNFYQGEKELVPWRRARRLGVPTKIGVDHLMASSAIPAIFPAVKLNREYFGDGSVRQLAPISPALHLGAERILVIGVSANATSPAERTKPARYPSLAQIAGHVLNSAFLDSLEGDIERLLRVNRTLNMVPPEIQNLEGFDLRPVEVLEIDPSEAIDEIAAEHAHELPRTIRFFLRGSGATSSAGSVILSYLLFEQGFCSALINLGYKDAMRREHEILRFLGYDPLKMHDDGIVHHDTW